jgi:hypothetical protein
MKPVTKRAVKPRITSHRTPNRYELTIAAKRSWFWRILGAYWLMCWLAGAVALPSVVMSAANRPPVALIALFLAFWLISGGGFCYLVLWRLIGREVVTVESGRLTIRRSVLGLGRTRMYDVSQIHDLRPSGLFGSFDNWSGMMKFYGLTGGVVAFDYGDETIRFGVHLDEAEAREVVRDLESHLR